MKIEAAVRNARAFLKVQEEFGKFDAYCWQFVGGRPRLNRWKSTRQIPATTPESDALSKDLKRRGFNDHLVDCFRYREILRAISDAT